MRQLALRAAAAVGAAFAGVDILYGADGHPTVLRGGVGLIHQRMVRCWSRRPDAPWASRRADRAA